MMERDIIPLFPLNTVLFPGMLLPLHIFEDRYKVLLKDCLDESREFGVVLLRSGSAESAYNQDIHAVGTTAQIRQVDAIQGERFNIITFGVRRFRVIEVHPGHRPYLTATVEYYPMIVDETVQLQVLTRRVAHLTMRYLDLYKDLKGERFRLGQMPHDPLTLAFLVGVILPIENEIKQNLLSQNTVYDILHEEFHILTHETLILQLIKESRPRWAKDPIKFYPN